MGAESILGVMGNIASTAINNYGANYRTEQDRKENYKYGEMAAENADRRTRALYADFYSPEALKRQYEAAGLSPSMMFGGTPGQGGMSGAQGSGAAGPQTPFMPISLLEGAQVANIMADTAKKKEETKNISTDTQIKELERSLSEMTNEQFKITYEAITTEWKNPETGEMTSLYQIADDCYSETNFFEVLKKYNKDNEIVNKLVSTEQGNQILRSIFYATSKMNRDIQVLSAEGVSAKFQADITRELEKEGFIGQNAKAAVNQLKALTAESELTEQQKTAWNNVLKRMEKLGDWKDIIVVLAMIVGDYAKNSNIKINTGDTFINKQQ